MYFCSDLSKVYVSKNNTYNNFKFNQIIKKENEKFI